MAPAATVMPVPPASVVDPVTASVPLVTANRPPSLSRAMSPSTLVPVPPVFSIRPRLVTVLLPPWPVA